MNAADLDLEKIYNKQTKEYVSNVIASYAIGDYRSATVMLYSVVVYDLMQKLMEMSTYHEDAKARNILNDVEKHRHGDKQGVSPSAWEKELIDKIHKNGNILSQQDYQNISHLYSDRNLSAHPSMNEDNELVSPSKETTLAHIKNMYAGVFSKPAIAMANPIDVMTEDLSKSKIYFENNYELLKNYLNKKYIARMSRKMLLSVFKAYWKFCFVSNGEEYKENRQINIMTLRALTEVDLLYTDDFWNEIDLDLNNIAKNDLTLANLICQFLTRFPDYYERLNPENRQILDQFVQKNSYFKLLSWYRFKTKSDFLNNISELNFVDSGFSANQNFAPLKVICMIMVSGFKEIGMQMKAYDLLIDIYLRSSSYDVSDERYDACIKPNLRDFTNGQLIRIISGTNENDQISGRRQAWWTNTEVIDELKNRGEKIDLSKYQNIRCRGL